MNYLCKELDAGNKCPACPSVSVSQVEGSCSDCSYVISSVCGKLFLSFSR